MYVHEMGSDELDKVDRGILFLLQQDARNATTTEIAEHVGVSAGTVRNRIERLEERGILKGYVPNVDYEKAGFPLHILFTCTAPSQPDDDFVLGILDHHGVVTVRKLLAGNENLHIEAIGTNMDDISEIAADLQEAGLNIVRSEVLEDEFIQPFDHFGAGVVDD